MVDANILLSVLLGRRSRPLFDVVARSRTIVTSTHATDEVRGVLRGKPDLPGGILDRADALLRGIGVIDKPVYADRMDDAAWVLTHAVASRNGSTTDAHLLACAWVFDADIWSHDRDFAGSGWPSWSNANLSGAIAAGPG